MKKAQRVVLNVERLEERATPANFGFAWPDASHLTLSFAPDGTSTGSQQSQLFQKLTAQYSTSTWEKAILRAFQTWAVQANVNIGLVADGGQALGTAGAFQTDSRFGDFRVASSSLSSSSLVAVGTPFDPTVGTWSGDVVFNSANTFTVGTGGKYDLFTVALHEAGHSFGLADNNDTTSIMYSQYDGTKTQLSSGDIAAIQALYGPRQPDIFGYGHGNSGNGTNHSIDGAADLNISDDHDGYKSVSVAADITAAGEADYYAFSNPSSNAKRGVTIQVQTGGVSLLVPQVTVYDSSGHVVATATAADVFAGTVSVRLTNVADSADYTIKVNGGTSDVFAQGAYHLQVLPDSAGNTAPNQVGYASSALSDFLTDNVFPWAKHLAQNFTTTNNRFDYTYHDSLSSPTDVETYRIRAPQPVSGAANTMTVVVWAQQASGLNPTVNVYDSQGHTAASQVVLNENGAYDVQVPNAVANAYYYVAVSAADTTNANNAGPYFAGVDFNLALVQQQQMAQATLTNSAKQAGRTVVVNQTQSFHFALTASTGTALAAAVRMTVYDGNGSVVYTLVAHNGETRTGTVLLTAGTYKVRFAGATQGGSALPSMNVGLTGLIGCFGDLGPGTVSPGSSTGSGSSGSSGPAYTWSPDGSYAFLGATDPYSNPYW